MLRTDSAHVADLLGHPFIDEELGTSDCPLLIIDFSGPQGALSDHDVSALRSLPAVVVGRGIEHATADPSVRHACDLFASDDDGELAGKVEASPLASVVLAQLVRLTERLSVRDALVAESLAYSTLQTGPTYQAWLSGRTAKDTDDLATEPPVIVDTDDDRTGSGEMVITFNRPNRHNAFSAKMRDLLVEALRVAAAADIDVTVRGNGPSFCSGGDLDEFGTTPDSATAHLVRSTRSAPWWISQRKERIRFDLHGSCLGAGVELAAFAGTVRAHPDTTFALPEIAFGLIPGAGGTVSITRRIGRQRTMELALSSAPIDAPTALAWGLIDEIHEH